MAASSSSPQVSRTSRRRQRSVRVTVAVALLGVATAVVLLALPTQSPAWLSVSSVFALLCGWAAARIVYNELAQSRREAARDRAAQAQAYRSMFTTRAEEHAEFTSAMTDRLVRGERERVELAATVVLAEQRAIEAETRLQREARRLVQAQQQLAELQERLTELEIRTAEEADELATWADDGSVGSRTVEDLMAWEQQVAATTASETPSQQHA